MAFVIDTNTPSLVMRQKKISGIQFVLLEFAKLPIHFKLDRLLIHVQWPFLTSCTLNLFKYFVFA